ncbi:MAG: YeeE/YedE family protein [Burkholderiales bacterium]|nr:YeeE/YedE family protein [Burkholderiales bacterium]
MSTSALPAGALPPGAGRAARIGGNLLAIIAVLAGWLAVTWLAGLRQGLLFLIGIGFGAVLSGAAFGFTTGWRVWIKQRDPTGMLAQFLAIGLATAVSIPLLAQYSELSGAAAPLSWSLLIGAFVFGAAMQVADGCGSGTLYKAGLGHPVSLAVFPSFVAGSFLGAAHLDAWLSLGALPAISLGTLLGTVPAVLVELLALALIGAVLWTRRRTTTSRWQGRGIYIAAIVMAVLAVLNLVVAGQPWGIVYGLGLWGAKIVTWAGFDLSSNPFWGRELQQAQIAGSLLDDVTSVTNLGLLLGSFLLAWRRRAACPSVGRITHRQWLWSVVAGFVLGYSSRLAFGCNVGAFFSGISTGSVHGWVWFAFAFAGSLAGVRLRERIGFKG